MELKYDKIQTTGTDTPLKIVKGHFATNHAHTNYYFDLTTVKSRLSEAGGIAQALVHMYLYDMIVDTIVCMEGTEVIGTLLAQELTKGGFMSKNAHKTIYVIKPEFNSNSQIVFKDNYRAMINGKNVLILTATVTTGLTINKAIEGVQYYGGVIQGISAVFSALENVNGIPIKSVFGLKEVHTSYKKKLLAIFDKVLIIKHSNIAEGQLERRRKDMTNLILLAVVIRIIVSIIVVNGNAYLRYTESGIA